MTDDYQYAVREFPVAALDEGDDVYAEWMPAADETVRAFDGVVRDVTRDGTTTVVRCRNPMSGHDAVFRLDDGRLTDRLEWQGHGDGTAREVAVKDYHRFEAVDEFGELTTAA